MLKICYKKFFLRSEPHGLRRPPGRSARQTRVLRPLVVAAFAVYECRWGCISVSKLPIYILICIHAWLNASRKKRSRSLGTLQRRRPDLNRCILVLQTIALPLGYRAILTCSNSITWSQLSVKKKKAPRAGLEPATTRLTAECSTIELSRNMGG